MSAPRPPTPPGRAHHVAVLCQDLDRAEAFYAGVLGLPVLTRHRFDDGGHRSTWVALGHASFLALERASPGAARRDEQGPGWHCVAFAIEASERERWREHLEAAGYPIERETRFTLYVRDPDGAWVALSHHPTEAPM